MTAGELSAEEIQGALLAHGSVAAAARALDVDRRRLSERIHRHKLAPAAPGKATVEVKGDEATVTAPIGTTPDQARELIRENGLAPDEWVIVALTLNKWDGPVKGGGKQTLRQVKVTLRRKPELIFPTPVAHVPEIIRGPRVERSREMPTLTIVEGDHQAPYHDEALDAAVTAMTADLLPDTHVFLGDLMDFPTISRHPDHPAATATVMECLDAGYGILRRRAEASPSSRRLKLKGNHDWRPEGELLNRAERMYGIRPVGEDLPALSLRRLMHLDALGVELIEHTLGWEHAEIELVPGVAGLVVRHGWMTGANTAGRSLSKRGRSLLVGHTHSREHVFQWDPSAQIERQAAVVGTMSQVRGASRTRRGELATAVGVDIDRLFPHFAVLDGWLQGCAVVNTWPDGRFTIEHALWDGESLRWRDRRYTPEGRAA